MTVGTVLAGATLSGAVLSEPESTMVRPALSTTVTHRIPAGWYPDRENPTRRRWWNGTDWTEFYTATVSMAEPAVTSKTPHATMAPHTPTTEARGAPSPRHSAATGPSPLPGAPSTAQVSDRATLPVPVTIFVSLAGLVGANTVLLLLLALAH